MVSESLGEYALKAAAFCSAAAVLPPLFLDDRSKPSQALIFDAAAVAAVMVAISLLFAFIGAARAPSRMRVRYGCITCGFIVVSGLLFATALS